MSVSHPPTPPSRVPTVDEQRFKAITSPCEWVEDYRPGGYHPIHLGDVLRDGQYSIVRKLGEGSYSTVWLARDLRKNRYVALKILVSEISDSTSELRILRHIAETAPGAAPQHTIQLLDDFQLSGPNGTHKVLVFEPMGASVNSMVEQLPQFNPRKWGMKVRYPPHMARSILKQSLQALEFLHGVGVSHGDFQPGNLLFSVRDIESAPEEVIRQAEDVKTGSISPLVERLDGKQDRWAPRYLCVAQPLQEFTHYTQGFTIKLSDMGGAFFFTDPPTKPVTPVGLRAPELILTKTVDRTLDIWSFGCLIFELMTGQPLFCIPGSDFEDDEHLLSLTATSMEELFDRADPDIDEEEACAVKELIRRILRYNPTERPSPAELLRDPWFSKIDVETGLLL
ncbi:Serine/threonine-protein kinase SRPK [Colletotrichum shisoi]|uniref:non-specific serine/threonine protein kinase n=1 Tax=Colletotrichum shisoi TaxID=2078593 RepID=A0A5Q4BNE3_9PEZI|nr:Serine/threonine-protein kinase SRPK [Colletotrichum shisoi]